MKRILMTLTFAAGMVIPVVAQTKAPVTVTGCLAQGDETNEYAIKDTAGKTYGLTGTKVDMKAHLGHEVTITGTEYKENEAKEKNEKKAAGKTEESAHLRVTDLKMVSTTCK